MCDELSFLEENYMDIVDRSPDDDNTTDAESYYESGRSSPASVSHPPEGTIQNPGSEESLQNAQVLNGEMTEAEDPGQELLEVSASEEPLSEHQEKKQKDLEKDTEGLLKSLSKLKNKDKLSMKILPSGMRVYATSSSGGDGEEKNSSSSGDSILSDLDVEVAGHTSTESTTGKKSRTIVVKQGTSLPEGATAIIAKQVPNTRPMKEEVGDKDEISIIDEVINDKTTVNEGEKSISSESTQNVPEQAVIPQKDSPPAPNIPEISSKNSEQPPPPPPLSQSSGSSVESNDGEDQKMFPSLSTRPLPSLKPKISKENLAEFQSELIDRVRAMLNLSPLDLTKYLIRNGLILNPPKCSVHPLAVSKPEFKLRELEENKANFENGGCHWLFDCCPERMENVFYDSIFELKTYPPPVILKLLYHWSCQAQFRSILNWVPVTISFLKSFFTLTRSLCRAALDTFSKKMGGEKCYVQIGFAKIESIVNSTTYFMEILGVFDPKLKTVRLGLVNKYYVKEEPTEAKAQELRIEALNIIKKWVKPESIILIDKSLDAAIFTQMGFSNVQSCHPGDAQVGKPSIKNIISYLNTTVNKLLTNIHGLLSKNLVQQFLDELAWREQFGFTHAEAFDSMIEHIVRLTELPRDDTFLQTMNKVIKDPFGYWDLAIINSPKKSSPPTKQPPPPPPPLQPKALAPQAKPKGKATAKTPKPHPTQQPSPQQALASPAKPKAKAATKKTPKTRKMTLKPKVNVQSSIEPNPEPPLIDLSFDEDDFEDRKVLNKDIKAEIDTPAPRRSSSRLTKLTTPTPSTSTAPTIPAKVNGEHSRASKNQIITIYPVSMKAPTPSSSRKRKAVPEQGSVVVVQPTKRLRRQSTSSAGSSKSNNKSKPKKKNLPPNPKQYTQERISLQYGVLDDEQRCHECGASLGWADHFPGYMKCGACPFATFCKASMVNHQVKCHTQFKNELEISKSSLKILRPSSLESPLICTCGFSTLEGFKMADHLVLCAKMTAFGAEANKEEDDDEIYDGERSISPSKSVLHQSNQLNDAVQP